MTLITRSIFSSSIVVMSTQQPRPVVSRFCRYAEVLGLLVPDFFSFFWPFFFLSDRLTQNQKKYSIVNEKKGGGLIDVTTTSKEIPRNSQLRFQVHDLMDNYVMKLPSSQRTSRISNELRKRFVKSFVKRRTIIGKRFSHIRSLIKYKYSILMLHVFG